LSRCLHSIVSVFNFRTSHQNIEQVSNHMDSMQTGLMRPLSSRNEPLSFRTSTKLPQMPFCKKKGTPVFTGIPFVSKMVPKGGLEPPRVSPPPPQEAQP
jgi:hypothetical protein